MVEEDSLPVRILPQLEKEFPAVDFIEIDPNENFTPPQDKPLYIIDTVVGIKEVTVFNDLNSFTKNRAISPHDYDLYLHLKLLQKLEKLPHELHIIGVPPTSN